MKHRYITLRTANAFIVKNHRHCGRCAGAIVAVGLFKDETLIGVATIGRPSSRRYDYRIVCEIARLCVEPPIKNACSKLYGALCRIATDLGFEKVITYTKDSEDGASLRAAGFVIEATSVGGKGRWNGRTNSVGQYPDELKTRWARPLRQ